MGTQKNRLNEHPKHTFKLTGKKIITIAPKYSLLGPIIHSSSYQLVKFPCFQGGSLYIYEMPCLQGICDRMGAQGLSGRVLDSRPRGRG